MSFSTYKKSEYHNNDFHRGNNQYRSRTTSESSFGSSNHHQGSKLCDSWLSGKSCRFGSRCWYAHGPWELRHYNDNHDNALHEQSRNQPPTLAQRQWMMMSQQSEQSQAFAHEAILLGNRFNRDRDSRAEFRFSPPTHAKLDPNNTKKNISNKKHNNNCSKGREITIKPLLELLKDVDEVPLRTNNSANPFSSFSSTETLNQATYPHDNVDHLAKLLASLSMIAANHPKTNTHEICDIYAISGYCPLGEECCFEHKARLE